MEKKSSIKMDGVDQVEGTTSMVNDRSAIIDGAETSTTVSERQILRKIDRWCVSYVLLHRSDLICLAFYP
jgi:hypothetical protein